MKIPGIFTDRREMVYFMMSVLLCATLFILVYNPIVDISIWNLPQPWSGKIYTALLVFIGFLLMIILRIFLFRLQRRFDLSFSFYVLWAVGEMVLFTFLLSIVSYLITQGDKPYILIFVRAFLDVIAIMCIPYGVVVLMFIIRERDREIAQLSEQLASLSGHVSELPVGGMIASVATNNQTAGNEVLNFYDRSGRFVFSTHANHVLYVESADNYCNIHYINDNHEDYYILHNSMKNVNEAYADKGLLRCHRCYMVNVEKVKLVKKVKDGLVLELSDTDKVVPVSKTYANIVIKYFVK